MKTIVAARQSGKTTELYEWLTRGKPIETDYCGHPDFIWNRGIVTISEGRKRSTQKFLRRWLLMHPTYHDAPSEQLALLHSAVYEPEEIRDARTLLWNPMREGRMEFAVDNADEMLEQHLGTSLAVVTMTGSAYEREPGEATPIQHQGTDAVEKSNVDEMLRFELRKGYLSL